MEPIRTVFFYEHKPGHAVSVQILGEMNEDLLAALSEFIKRVRDRNVRAELSEEGKHE